MKQTIKLTLALVLCLSMLLCLVSCAEKVDATGRWEDATWRSDREFGEGEVTVQVEVKVEEQSVTFTIHTDREMLGDALLEHELLEGDEGPYGLYVKRVNGMLADYDVDGTYWALYKDGAYATSGVDTTKIADGEHYELVLSK